jgi:hypothetical protein
MTIHRTIVVVSGSCLLMLLLVEFVIGVILPMTGSTDRTTNGPLLLSITVDRSLESSLYRSSQEELTVLVLERLERLIVVR